MTWDRVPKQTKKIKRRLKEAGEGESVEAREQNNGKWEVHVGGWPLFGQQNLTCTIDEFQDTGGLMSLVQSWLIRLGWKKK